MHRLSGRIITVLSFVALTTVLIGYTQPRLSDEGAGAHIFQLSIVALAPALLLFLGTADWGQPLRSLRPLLLPAIALLLAFCALYRLEH